MMRYAPPRQKQTSYWQLGFNDARNGEGYNKKLQYAAGYDNGYRCGDGHARPVDESPMHYFKAPAPEQLPKSPYMELISKVEASLEEVSRPMSGVDRRLQDEYRLNLLEVRDTLHRFRQAEMVQGL